MSKRKVRKACEHIVKAEQKKVSTTADESIIETLNRTAKNSNNIGNKPYVDCNKNKEESQEVFI